MAKRTISKEHLAKMQEGKRQAKKQRDRVAMLSELDDRLAEGKRASERPVRMPKAKRRHRPSHKK